MNCVRRNTVTMTDVIYDTSPPIPIDINADGTRHSLAERLHTIAREIEGGRVIELNLYTEQTITKIDEHPDIPPLRVVRTYDIHVAIDVA